MDCLVDANVILRAADQAHSSSDEARRAMRKLFMQGNRLCLAKQSLVESWVVATRPRDKNGLGLSPSSFSLNWFERRRFSTFSRKPTRSTLFGDLLFFGIKCLALARTTQGL
jgi:hypothetical protein